MERKVIREKVSTIEEQVDNPEIRVDDHGMNSKLAESAAGLNQYMKTLQNESELLAQQKHDETLVHHIEERIESERHQRHKLAKEAERKEAETLYKLKEARHAAKEMMDSAKAELHEQETSPTIVERITETFTGKAGRQIH